MDTQVIEAIQKQMNNERMNAQKYLYIADGFENMAYNGLARFFRSQAQGELEHAKKFADFLISKRVQPRYDKLETVSVPVSAVAYAEKAYETELETTANLEELYDVSSEAGAYQACALLDWFLTEQIEEETWSFDLLDLIRKADANGLLLIDERYGK